MTTALELVNETREHLLSGIREPINRLNGALAAGATTFVVSYELGSIAPGAIVSIDLERIRIWEVDAGTKTVTVCERGVESTTDAAHSSLAEVRVNTRFDNFKILRALNEDLKALSSPSLGLWQMKQVDLVYASGVTGYELPDVDLIDVYRVQRETASDTSKEWHDLLNWDYVEGANATDFPSGQALFLHEPGIPTKIVRVWYRARLGLLTDTADVVETVTGLSADAVRLPVLGALAQLMPVREHKRTFTESQGEPRRAEEVPVGASFQSARGAHAVRNERLIAEATRLRAQYPIRKRIRR